jgi:hypothetical protein
MESLGSRAAFKRATWIASGKKVRAGINIIGQQAKKCSPMQILYNLGDRICQAKSASNWVGIGAGLTGDFSPAPLAPFVMRLRF